MIKLVPLEDKETLKELCRKHGVLYNDTIRAYNNEGGEEKGVCIFSLDGFNMEIFCVEYDKSDPLMAELLVRSAANYGANRSGYIVRMRSDEIKDILLKLNFVKNDDGYIAKVPKILEGSCHCKNK